MTVALALSGWMVVALLLAVVRARFALAADAEHELRGAAAALRLAAEGMERSRGGRGFAALVAVQLDRMTAALSDLDRSRRRPLAAAPAEDGGRTRDSARLAQVVANLVANAAEHGTGPVEVRWDATGPGARLEIRNRNRPLELDDLTTRRAANRGRGLGIADRAARELGGRVRVDASGDTTVATLDLPAGDSKPAA